jgi:hypothetical protein
MRIAKIALGHTIDIYHQVSVITMQQLVPSSAVEGALIAWLPPTDQTKASISQGLIGTFTTKPGTT